MKNLIKKGFWELFPIVMFSILILFTGIAFISDDITLNNAIAVWRLSDGIRSNIWANRYVLGSGWGTAELIETDNTGRAFEPKVAVDPSGNAKVVKFWNAMNSLNTSNKL